MPSSSHASSSDPLHPQDAPPGAPSNGACDDAASLGWRASLELGVAHANGRSRIEHLRHTGPLRVQKAFHPEPNGTCHIYVLHPPGGIAGGDELRIGVDVAARARALVTSPAAQKLYRSATHPSVQRIALRVGSGHLEWLPQETIAFAGTQASIRLHVELEDDAAFIGWDILCLGRPACDERFDRGWIDQTLEIQRGGRPVWSERLHIQPGSPLLTAPWGLRGCTTLATLVCSPANPACVEALRDTVRVAADEHFAATAPRGLIVCRFLGAHAWRAREALASAWNVLRPAVIGSQAVPPRIWST